MIPVQTFICADRQCKAFIRLPAREAAYRAETLLRLGIFPMRCLSCGKLQAPYVPEIEMPPQKEAAGKREAIPAAEAAGNPAAPFLSLRARPAPSAVGEYLKRVNLLIGRGK